jgi:hypothetical protein
MLTVLLLSVFAITGILLVLFAFVCLAIRKEDRAGRLDVRPPTLGTALTRRITGLSVRMPASIEAGPDAGLYSHGAGLPEEDLEGR